MSKAVWDKHEHATHLMASSTRIRTGRFPENGRRQGRPRALGERRKERLGERGAGEEKGITDTDGRGQRSNVCPSTRAGRSDP